MLVDVVCALGPTWSGRELQSRLAPSSVLFAADARELDAALRAGAPQMVIARTDLLPTPIDDWIRNARDLPRRPDVILVHDREDAKFRAGAIRAGCIAVLNSTLSLDELADTVQVLIERRSNGHRVLLETSRSDEGHLRDFVSRNPRMRELMILARKVADADSSLLLLGETGTGKERLARAIHNDGIRSTGPFVAVNCAALPESLFESEMLGYEKGAFTGASRARKGYLEQADGGTLLLDEIAEVPLHLQVKLLRVLEERRLQRLGAERSVPVDLRIVGATNRNLEKAVEEGRFREDLYYRLAVVTLTIPPLRERAEDIPALFRRYFDLFRTTLNRPILGVETTAREALFSYRWPGNVRELANVVERAVLLSPGPDVRLADLPPPISSPTPGDATSRPPAPPPSEAPPPWLGSPLIEARQQVVSDFEKRYLRHLLRETGGRIRETARRAEINERSLYELMRRHGLRKEEFRGQPRRE